MPAKRKMMTRSRNYHPDDLSYAVLGQRFFKGGTITTMAELRDAWKDPLFRKAVIAHAEQTGRADKVYMQKKRKG